MFDQPVPDPNSLPFLRRAVTMASVAVSGTLILAKLGAYFATDSVALLSSMLDSSVDLLASLITAFAVRRAMKPPDRDHRFGHGKAEPLAALAQAAFIGGSSILLCIEAINRFKEPRALQNEGWGYAVMGLAIVLTILLLSFQSYVIRRTQSFAISADRMHYVGDVAINLAVIATFGLQQITDVTWFDPVFALAIAASLLWGAGKILMDSLHVLMDREIPEEDRERILATARSVPGVEGIHDLRTRTDSGHIFAEMHIELDPAIPLARAHDIAEAVMRAVMAIFPNADVLVHQDPKGHHEERLDTQIEATDPPLSPP